MVDTKKLLKVPCGHDFCFPCSRRMATTALDNLELFPARCCTREIPPKSIVAAMSSRNRKRYMYRWEEHKTSPIERLYCPRASCGQWIPFRSPGSRLGHIVCPYCRAKICPNCRDFHHFGWSCSHSPEIRAVLELARENNWQRCSNCLYLVEKVDGCNHIVCRCGSQFWYVC
jgi:E3 ubiquitin-protein ligase RNF144